MNVLIVSGFLGSGKTTVLLELLQNLTARALASAAGSASAAGATGAAGSASTANSAVKVALVENEVGDVSIDGDVLAAGGMSVRNLFSGCVCCTLSGELIPTFRDIEQQLNPDWAILETTGIADPNAIRETLQKYLPYPVTTLIVVDAARWLRIRKPLEMLLNTQVSGADIALINKCDIAEEESIAAAEEDIRAINPTARTLRTCRTEPLPQELYDLLASGRAAN